MELNALTAVSPIDGRYHAKTASLANYFSEYALIKYRVRVEIEYFIALCQIPLPQLANLDSDLFDNLRRIYLDFSLQDAARIKDLEKVTNHDVKAVEYFIKEKFNDLGIHHQTEFVHFGLTSQDINNTAIPLMLKEAQTDVVLPLLHKVTNAIEGLAKSWENIPMLAYTHGQPASPTRLGKEMKVFSYRIAQQQAYFQHIPYAAKFGGATGNFNAHFVAYPQIDWINFSQNFVNQTLGLSRSFYTTQIENYDHLAAYFDNWKRINTILIDFSRDIWQYISLGYFKQKINPNEIGSSAMPHKVNPIDFENAEGNLAIANAGLEFLASKLPISRLQRDLTDSTVLRNIGVPIGHILIALESLAKGIGKLELNQARINEELEHNLVVVAEAIQTVLRREGFPKPYEALKALTRKSDKITAIELKEFIENLSIEESIKTELKNITQYNYTGIMF
jgi:adenylosuccinate lyase